MSNDGLRNRWATWRVRPGTGKPLKRYRWWHFLNRSLTSLTLGHDGSATTYAVDVRHMGDAVDGTVRAHLYRDGIHVSKSAVPAHFAVPGGIINVHANNFGLRYCNYVRDDSISTQLTPHNSSAEGWRARLHREHPALSLFISIFSVLLIIPGACVALLKLAEILTQIPPVTDAIGTFISPIELSLTATLTVGAAAIAGSTERALRLRTSWLDSLAN